MPNVVDPPHSLTYSLPSPTPRTPLTYLIAISSFVIGTLSLAVAITQLSILGPSWLRLTRTVFARATGVAVYRIWQSSSATMADAIVGAVFAVMLIVGGVSLLQGMSKAPRFLVRCAAMRAVAALVGAAVTLPLLFHSALGSQETIAAARWLVAKSTVYSITLSLASSLALILLLKVQARRAIR